jgi:predicted aconitase/predicted aconitase with swiveling domain
LISCHHVRHTMEVPAELRNMLAGELGPTKQKAARLVTDLGYVAGAEHFTKAVSAHVSGVSVITGGIGLRRFLADLSSDSEAKVAIPTTLNSAGCDSSQFERMGIDFPDFLRLQTEIISAYWEMGIETTLSCTPYDHPNEAPDGIGCWAESNAVCFANTYTNLVTNRESGLSALSTALTGWAPMWGLHLEGNRVPNLHVNVNCELHSETDFSILGDWIGSQIQPGWDIPFGPMPFISGLGKSISFEKRKALTAAAANFGCPMLWLDGISPQPSNEGYLGLVEFTSEDLQGAYDRLGPKGTVDLVVIGCPQASIGEVRSVVAEVRGRVELGQRIPDNRLWVFTSSRNHEVLSLDGSLDILEEAGALLLKDTCPEVTPYNRKRYNHILTNSMKAEHYLKSGLNSMPTSVARIPDCIAHAFDPELSVGPRPVLNKVKSKQHRLEKKSTIESEKMVGTGLPSQESFDVTARAVSTDVPITYLGYVDPETGVIIEKGHPLEGQSMAGKIVVYPKGSGSTVAPYVLMGMNYHGVGPKGILNRDVCPLTLPAASLHATPYGHGFDFDPTSNINTGDLVRMRLADGVVEVEVIERASNPSRTDGK